MGYGVRPRDHCELRERAQAVAVNARLRSGDPVYRAARQQCGYVPHHRAFLRRAASADTLIEMMRASEWRCTEISFTPCGVLQVSPHDYLPIRVQMLPGENRRDRVLTNDEEARYFQATVSVGDAILAAHAKAREGIRAKRGEMPQEPEDPFLLHDVTTVLPDCGLRPEESFRLRWQHVWDGALNIPFGKTENSRRRIPFTQRVEALLSMRRGTESEGWVFPAPTRSRHIGKSSLKKQHHKAVAVAKVEPFTLSTLRHTCLTRWAAHMDPFTLAYLAGYRFFHH